MYNLDLDEVEEQDQIANIHWITEKNKEISGKHLLLLHWPC